MARHRSCAWLAAMVVTWFVAAPARVFAQAGGDDEWEQEFADERQDDAGVAEGDASETTGGEDQQGATEGSDDGQGSDEGEATDGEGGDGAGATEATEGREQEDSESLVPHEPAWDRAYRAQSTYLGGSGGMHVLGAEGLPEGVFRLQLGLQFFAVSGLVRDGDTHSRVGGALTLGAQIHDLVELYGSLHSYATANDRQAPNLYLVLGDIRAGVKVFFHPAPWLGVGGALEAYFPTSGDLGFDFGAMGARILALGTADLRELDDPIPLIARVSAGYRIDNTESLVNGLEARRYSALPDPMPEIDETRHLVTPFERTALGVSRTDYFDIGIGLEAPLRVARDLYISPLVEWTWAIPVNRQGYDCAFVPTEPGGSDVLPGTDSCLAAEGVGATPMTLSFGIRVLPPVPGFTAFVGADVGLTGQSIDSAVRELPLNAPYDVHLGVAYAFDTRPPPDPEVIIREVDKEVEVPTPLPPEGRVIGSVVEQQSGQPIERAIVHFPATPWSSLLAENGRFTTYRFPPGTHVEMEVTADEHEPGRCEGTIPEDASDIEVRCELVKNTLVRVEETEIRILEQINFAFDSDEILASSFDLMGQIAQVINDNPQILRIEIQGHTDNEGTEVYNAGLSQRRADSVKRWLVEHGVTEGRLRGTGYGESRPLVPNDSEQNRARNRRVQFVIEERAPATEGTPEVQGE